MTMKGRCWISAAGTASPPPPSAAPSANATATGARSPAATHGAPTCTTSATGPGAAPPATGTSSASARPTIVHDTGYLIIRDDTGGFTFTRPDGTPVPNSPELPAPAAGDITTRHDAPITPDTIQTAAGERMNLHLTIWAAFANARINRKRAAGQ
jgi:hypothetical protein